MFVSGPLLRHPDFRAGWRDFLPVAPGIVAWGLMTGVAMLKSGLSLEAVLLMAVLVFAGSSQLAAIPLIIAGAPLWVVWATAFCVNLRFMVFSLHLRDYVAHLPRWQRVCCGYFTADLSYVLFIRRFPHPASEPAQRDTQVAWLLGNGFFNWLTWISASLLGVLLANFIPQSWGLGFAGTLCLIGILCSLATGRMRVVSAAVAGAMGVSAFALPLKLNIVFAIAVAVVACLALEHMRAVRR